MSNQTLSLIDRTVSHLGPLDTVVGALARHIAPQIDARAACDGGVICYTRCETSSGWCNFTQQREVVHYMALSYDYCNDGYAERCPTQSCATIYDCESHGWHVQY